MFEQSRTTGSKTGRMGVLEPDSCGTLLWLKDTCRRRFKGELGVQRVRLTVPAAMSLMVPFS